MSYSHLMGNQIKIMNIMYINVHCSFICQCESNNLLVNLEGHVCGSKIVLTKRSHSTSTYAMPNTYTYDTWTLYMNDLNAYMSEA